MWYNATMTGIGEAIAAALKLATEAIKTWAAPQSRKENKRLKAEKDAKKWKEKRRKRSKANLQLLSSRYQPPAASTPSTSETKTPSDAPKDTKSSDKPSKNPKKS